MSASKPLRIVNILTEPKILRVCLKSLTRNAAHTQHTRTLPCAAGGCKRSAPSCVLSFHNKIFQRIYTRSICKASN